MFHQVHPYQPPPYQPHGEAPLRSNSSKPTSSPTAAATARILVLFEWSFMTWWSCRKLENILYYHNMQYKVDPTDQSPENSQKPHFWLFGSFKNAFMWHLNDPSWSSNVVECWKTFSTITLCNIKSIQQNKVQKMAKNLYFGSLDHSKMHFSDFSMIFHDLVTLPKVGKQLLLSQYTISSRYNRSNSRKWPKTSILALWIIQKCISVTFEWSFTTW